MSSERIRIELARDDDAWSARIESVEQTSSTPDDPAPLIGTTHAGSGPADVLEQIGQTLDEREVDRIVRERGL